jgi:hypothetical protein
VLPCVALAPLFPYVKVMKSDFLQFLRSLRPSYLRRPRTGPWRWRRGPGSRRPGPPRRSPHLGCAAAV